MQRSWGKNGLGSFEDKTGGQYSWSGVREEKMKQEGSLGSEAEDTVEKGWDSGFDSE